MSNPPTDTRVIELQTEIVRTIKHRMVDLNWSNKKLCAEADVNAGFWSQITRNETQPSLTRNQPYV
jgi:hypothetical protein